MPSIFSKIVSGEIPCFKLFEDESFLAFMDINPVSPGHCLVITKAEYAKIEDVPAEVMAKFGLIVQRVGRAVRKSLGCPAYNLVLNNGPEAGQEVPHVHFHIIPRYAEDGVKFNWPNQSGDMTEIEKLAGRISEATGAE